MQLHQKFSRTSHTQRKTRKNFFIFFMACGRSSLSVCHFDEFLICNRFFAEIVQVQEIPALYATIFSYYLKTRLCINSKQFLEKFASSSVACFVRWFIKHKADKPFCPLYFVNILLPAPQSYFAVVIMEIIFMTIVRNAEKTSIVEQCATSILIPTKLQTEEKKTLREDYNLRM